MHLLFVKFSVRTFMLSPIARFRIVNYEIQEAQLSQIGSSMLHVFGKFAKSLTIIRNYTVE